MQRIWCSLDTDDIHHHPNISGHPSRSKDTPWPQNHTPRTMSERLNQGFDGFERWWSSQSEDSRITLFVVGEQLEDSNFTQRLQNLIGLRPGITIGVHGWHHICWSAWAPRPDEFKSMIEKSIEHISSTVGSVFRPWFRAPGGYIAPWMAPVLASVGISMDSSVNPVSLLRYKTGRDSTGKINGWDTIRKSMVESNIVEREWYTRHNLPVNGPALHHPALRFHSRISWRRLRRAEYATDKEIQSQSNSVVSLYWHLLDHARLNGNWSPPLQISK
ncbi:MAG: polysaccharide deacetylase family protein [Candidatus Thermoplasmatota archaeon]|jgi:peptidoglycan/xylan/chitin deacetylase (PgdA/CDA1 family)|nr:polysaccharide deacetylase family protein [Candidatus Thermoplasmatota archaeon]